MGLLKATMDALMGGADFVGGRAVTKLTAVLTETEAATMSVESTLRFGERTDDASDARLLVNGEIILATGRTESDPFTFTTLTRGAEGTTAKAHPVGALVVDLSENRSVLDFVRRGFLVDYAVGTDLDVIGRNLGLKKCPSIDQETWRRIIKAVAYLPKTTVDAFDRAMTALLDDADAFTITERLLTNPYEVFVSITVALEVGTEAIRGSFLLSGAYEADTDGLTTVTAPYDMDTVNGVYLSTPGALRGFRDGLTNYYASHVGDVITLSPSPGAVGTAVIIDGHPAAASISSANNYHYLATGYGADELILNFDPDGVSRYTDPEIASIQTIQLDENDHWAYLSDPLLAAKCLLNEIRQAGVKVNVEAVAP